MVRWLKIVKRLCLVFLAVFVIVTAGVLYYIEFELPDIDALNTVQLQVPLQVYTHDGKLIAEYGEMRRIPLPYDQIPQPLIDAVLATEDQRYFQHPGVDLPGLMRAAIKLVATGRKEQGGSTITMQVARSFYLTRHKTFGRKLREILLALKIDHKLSKQKILELYLNKIFFGSRAYGVEAAAEVYYGKSLNQLSIDQFAMLAGLPKAPSALNPLTNPEAAKKRRDHVLTRMVDLGYIDKTTYEKALASPLGAHFHELPTEVKARHVGDLVRQQLQEMYGDAIYTEGFKVYTTLDSRLQTAANQAVQSSLLAYDQRHGYRGPEANWGVPSLNLFDEWEKRLQGIRVINGLEPAVVIDSTQQTLTVLRANGALVTLPWRAMTWARKQINADYLGPKPKTTRDIAGPGDVVRIVSRDDGWQLAQLPAAEAGLVALNPTNGAILALVGGFDYQTSEFNRITNANRQPGSSFKPFIYSAALDKGFTLATIINDAPIVVENPDDNTLWRPQNDTRRFYGPTRLRDAITQSRNLVSIRLLAMVGIPTTVQYLERFGFLRQQLPFGLSLALGTASVTPLQMAAAYAIFANGGFKTVPFIIARIDDTQGKTIYDANPLTACPTCPPDTKPDPSHAPRVISASNAFLITSALHDVIERGTAVEARSLKRRDLAGKTGTTQNQVDAWFAGFNPDIVAVAWIGYDQPRSLHEYGAKAALPMWISFMQAILKQYPERPFEQPPGIVTVRIDPATGKPATPTNPNATFEYFMTPYLPQEETNISNPQEGTPPADTSGVY